MSFLHIAFLFFGTISLSFAATGVALRLLSKHGIMDNPNERSSHIAPTPRGGGIAVVIIFLLVTSFSINNAEIYRWLFLAAIFIALVSWIDDIRGLAPQLRLAAQFIAVGIVFWLTPSTDLYFHGLLPLWFDNIIAAILWVWFINLFNFMDGIDGITVVETSTIGLGLFGLMMMGAIQQTSGIFGLLVAAAVLGFLWWNWHPAKVFLGDVGSIPLGFILGWLLLETAASPAWPAAIILPLYYLGDASITLIRRGLRGEKVWLPHREHFYQQANQKGLSHKQVCLMIVLVNICLIGLAAFSLSFPLPALLVSMVVTGGLLFFFRRPA